MPTHRVVGLAPNCTKVCIDPFVQLFGSLTYILFAALFALDKVHHSFSVACHGGSMRLYLKHPISDSGLYKIAIVAESLAEFTIFLAARFHSFLLWEKSKWIYIQLSECRWGFISIKVTR